MSTPKSLAVPPILVQAIDMRIHKVQAEVAAENVIHPDSPRPGAFTPAFERQSNQRLRRYAFGPDTGPIPSSHAAITPGPEAKTSTTKEKPCCVIL